MPSVMVLGPSFDNHIEPTPPPTTTGTAPGRRQFQFQPTPTTPGGNVHLQVLPAANPNDSMPVNIYAFFVTPVSTVPPADQRTPDWFFKSGAANASVHSATIDKDGKVTIKVPGVKPSTQPYFVQTIMEHSS